MIDIDALIEVYSTMKQYVPAKDRQEAADNLMSTMVDMLSDDDLKEFGAVDSAMTRALKEYSLEEDDEEFADEGDNE
jgi:hypothetical protein